MTRLKVLMGLFLIGMVLTGVLGTGISAGSTVSEHVKNI